VGKSVSLLIPSRLGPRQFGQFSAIATLATISITSKALDTSNLPVATVVWLKDSRERSDGCINRASETVSRITVPA
jgi:hypothetical protein